MAEPAHLQRGVDRGAGLGGRGGGKSRILRARSQGYDQQNEKEKGFLHGGRLFI
jgi:hypothetical protein